VKKDHRKQVCNTLACFIARRKGITIKRIRYPDEEQRNVKAVDVLVESSSSEIVIEHTLIESYPGQIAEHSRIQELLKPLQTMLAGKLPTPGHYELSVAVGAVKGAKDTERIQSALIKWVKNKAPSLQMGSPDVAPAHYITEKPRGVPFEVTLYRWPYSDGKFWIILQAPEDLEEKRRQRISKALEEKCPKLFKARSDKRDSVLLFELDDISLGNHIAVANVISEELNLRNDIPDEIYLVRTEIRPWEVWVLKEGTRFFRGIENAGPHYLEEEH
jgi:hypothetical protein